MIKILFYFSIKKILLLFNETKNSKIRHVIVHNISINTNFLFTRLKNSIKRVRLVHSMPSNLREKLSLPLLDAYPTKGRGLKFIYSEMGLFDSNGFALSFGTLNPQLVCGGNFGILFRVVTQKKNSQPFQNLLIITSEVDSKKVKCYMINRFKFLLGQNLMTNFSREAHSFFHCIFLF